MSIFETVTKESIPLKVGMSGPSGSGKTYSSLLFAKGLVGDMSKVAVVDTENKSAKLYNHLGDFRWVDLKPPFTPEKYIELIKAAHMDESIECLILDSITPEWKGAGGMMDIQESYGGSFRAWAKANPHHNRFVNAILQSRPHIICTMRSKQGYIVGEKNGRQTIEKVGMEDEQRNGFEYELSLSFNINMQHLAEASKDRTGLFVDLPPFMIGEADGAKLKAWNEG